MTSLILAVVFILIILILSFSSYIYIIRIQQRLFMNPKYDYIKKLKLSTKLKFKRERLDIGPKEENKFCSSCRKLINPNEKFCEHCGSPQ